MHYGCQQSQLMHLRSEKKKNARPRRRWGKLPNSRWNEVHVAEHMREAFTLAHAWKQLLQAKYMYQTPAAAAGTVYQSFLKCCFFICPHFAGLSKRNSYTWLISKDVNGCSAASLEVIQQESQERKNPSGMTEKMTTPSELHFILRLMLGQGYLF